jgi:hypothetical protein
MYLANRCFTTYAFLPCASLLFSVEYYPPHSQYLFAFPFPTLALASLPSPGLPYGLTKLCTYSACKRPVLPGVRCINESHGNVIPDSCISFLDWRGWMDIERLLFPFFNVVYTAASINRRPGLDAVETLIGPLMDDVDQTPAEAKIHVPFLHDLITLNWLIS